MMYVLEPFAGVQVVTQSVRQFLIGPQQQAIAFPDAIAQSIFHVRFGDRF